MAGVDAESTRLVPISMLEVALLCAEPGDADRGRILADKLSRYEHHHGVLPVPICYGGPVSRCLARLADVCGRSDEAAELFEETLDAATALGARPTQARILLEWGELLGRAGSRSKSRELRAAGAALVAALAESGSEAASPAARGRSID